MKLSTVGFIGAGGNIAHAILGGILKRGDIKPDDIYIYDLFPEKCDYATRCSVRLCESEAQVAENAQYIFLCVKPQQMEAALEQLHPALHSQQCLVSVAAGISMAYLESHTLSGIKIIRVMPNTPLLLGEGASALCKNAAVSDEEFQAICDVFRLSGEIEKCEESQINAVTAVSGSSPAYIFRFAKAIAKEGEAMGLSFEAALHLVSQTLIGSARMMMDSGMSVDELIQMVCSPGGTTLAALSYFDEHDFDGTIQGGMRRCLKRSEELSRGE